MSISALWAAYGSEYLQALLTTWKLTFFSFGMAFVLGILITVARVSPIIPLRRFGDFYVQIFRNIPGAALLILLVYAFPKLKLLFPYATCVLIATTLIPSAFCSEYLMSGMNMIEKGQIEAARALGMSFLQMIRRIIIPQALRYSVLPMTNLLVATMLTTALGSTVPMVPRELTGLVSHINTHATGGVTAFVISAAFYCATAVLIGFVGSRIDRKVRILR
ncbi:MAG: ABC transporter permease subunit [Clostridia bacterium]|nr:ABC transporter permease subunit [Clostridia bacterium]